MSKRINIQSLLQANKSLPAESFKGFLQYYGIEIKTAEIEDLGALVGVLAALKHGVSVFDKFYVSYRIPQIGKEFDLLRFGKKFIINIEIKKTCPEERVKKQLVRNKYYLSFVGRPVYAFTFVSDSKKLYFLRDDELIESVGFDALIKLLVDQEVNDAEIPDDLFDPSDYLVSPFNSTKKFLADEYFLTHQQEDVRTQILNLLCTSKSARFISLMGGAGTGKTLLIYDIAKEVMRREGSVLIIHCGQLNDGHYELREGGWSIVPIKSYAQYNVEDYDLVIVDEAQRIKIPQFDDIVSKVRGAEGCCIFSHDKLQTLANWEASRNISAKINSLVPIVQYTLSEKIRTNREIASFVKMLFYSKKTVSMPNDNNIEINYFSSVEDARGYLDALDGGKWEVLKFTPSQYYNEHHEKYGGFDSKTSHQVIGQEFDGVAVTIDQYFSYNDDGDLIYKGSAYYHPVKMLFQNITRCRRRLNIVIINNEQLLNRCIAILGAGECE
ncbi:ATP-binding protein [Burkholderia vietnamiensis]|uniref:ATP-binding protein n=1 Tax=Burkholderia vietnamiensis TaxID=60552 RepID=UPI000D78C43D|nr:ATP-binding protein [Burkholderia vietnamiensis]GBH24581.1 hypothetical protein BvRS1_16300 [Burkholderia vietnamiensis]